MSIDFRSTQICAIAMTAICAIASAAAAQTPRPLMEVLAECEAYALADPAAFAGMERIANRFDDTISYVRMETELGVVSAQLEEADRTCSAFGIDYLEQPHRTRVALTTAAPIIFEMFADRAGPDDAVARRANGSGRLTLCDGDTASMSLALSLYLTGDAAPAFAYRARVDPRVSRHCQ